MRESWLACTLASTFCRQRAVDGDFDASVNETLERQWQKFRIITSNYRPLERVAVEQHICVRSRMTPVAEKNLIVYIRIETVNSSHSVAHTFLPHSAAVSVIYVSHL